ncbi:hypothetical protein DQG23_17970 [Paenibacillus contaminans]|uniref:Uncharacterized protein n=1 Tax=Paenibacillus contaminans TaxID=450362 RepID=A0A329MJ34_9BACL|nr:hypothetical protein DQG23_17970 [Paenibacillus contaminans]
MNYFHAQSASNSRKAGACISRPGFYFFLDYDGRIPIHAAKDHAGARSARSALPDCTQRL